MEKTICIVLNYNDYETTIHLINEIKFFKSIDQIVVVDNCSNDNSVEEIKKYTSEKIVLLTSKKNGGYGAGNNVGIKYAVEKKADYIIIANPDTMFTDETVFQTIDCMKKDLRCAVISPISRKPDGTYSHPISWKKMNCLFEIITCGLVCNRLLGWLNLVSERALNSDCATIDVFAVPGSFFIVDMKKIKFLFNESVFLYCEEKFLGDQVQKQGFKIKLSLRTSYVHNHSVSINKKYNNYSKKIIWLKSKEIFIKSCFNLNFLEKSLLSMVLFVANIEYRIQSFVER